jgi:hypothetical protein
MKRAASPKAAARAISGEAFVRAWQAARSAEEAAEKLGLPVEGVRARAARYRKKGVPLQRFGGGRGVKTDWKALAELAKSLAPAGR